MLLGGPTQSLQASFIAMEVKPLVEVSSGPSPLHLFVNSLGARHGLERTAPGQRTPATWTCASLKVLGGVKAVPMLLGCCSCVRIC